MGEVKKGYGKVIREVSSDDDWSFMVKPMDRTSRHLATPLESAAAEEQNRAEGKIAASLQAAQTVKQTRNLKRT